MRTKSIVEYLLSNRVPFHQVFPLENGTIPMQAVLLRDEMFSLQTFNEHIRKRKLHELGQSFAVAEHVAEYRVDDKEVFFRNISSLTDEGWQMAIKHCPFHTINSVMSNIRKIEMALHGTFINLSTALMGMVTASQYSVSSEIYKAECDRATTALLTEVTLYSTYIDVSRRLVRQIGLDKSEPYKRAINRIIKKSIGAHSFLKDMRNFLNHYEIIEPGCTYGYVRDQSLTMDLVIPSHKLLETGFDWKREARTFIATDKNVNILRAIEAVMRDVARVIKFQELLVKTRNGREQQTYNYYTSERQRLQHLQKSQMRMIKPFRSKGGIIQDLIGKPFIEKILVSSLSNEEAINLLTAVANRFKNLPKSALDHISLEINALVSGRIRAKC